MFHQAFQCGTIEETNILSDYIEGVRGQLDVAAIRSAKLRILHDPIHGVSSSLPSRILGVDYVGAARIIKRPTKEMAGTEIDSIRGDVNPGFGGVNPEPIPENLVASKLSLIHISEPTRH